jgi:hypothetical protein
MRTRVCLLVLSVLIVATILDRRSPANAAGGLDKATCTFKGKRLYGKIQIVDAFPDVKVQTVKAFPDLKVQEVNAFPDRCGLWQMVKAFPDTKVQFVTAFPDVKVQFVSAFPGMP